MLVSYKNQYPIQLPDRIRLSNGLTRTGKETFTLEEILDSGYIPVKPQPEISSSQVLMWDGNDWRVEEIAKDPEIEWRNIRQIRNERISEVEWRINRYNSEVRLGLEPTDDIRKLDTYIQALRDITKHEDPFTIVWPELYQLL